LPDALSMTQVLDDLKARGFTANIGVVDEQLRVLDSGKILQPEEIVVREVHRFEGVSDPDEMSVAYAIESHDGIRGVLVDAFGVYADPAVGQLLKNVAQERPNRPRRGRALRV